MERLSGLRRAQIGGQRAPHKPLLLLWLFGRFAATGSALAPYAEAADPVSQLINDFGAPVRSPALERQRAAMPFARATAAPSRRRVLRRPLEPKRQKGVRIDPALTDSERLRTTPVVAVPEPRSPVMGP